MKITGFAKFQALLKEGIITISDFRPFKVVWLLDILESEETSVQNGEAQSKPSQGTEGGETKGGACGTTADEIPGTLTKVWANVWYRSFPNKGKLIKYILLQL